MPRRALAALLLTACTTMPDPASLPRTAPETSDWRRTTTYAELQEFLRGLRLAGDPRMVFGDFGRSAEGRALPLVVVAEPAVRTPQEARAAGKPVVLVTANIHAGEVEGKEACLELLREVAAGRAPWPVGEVVALIAPLYNADGNERAAPRNRPLQQGPDNPGQRANAAGLDLNRDALKLEAPESRALLALMSAWDPHLYVDLHTTNGSAHGYELTWAPSLSPSVEPTLAAVNADWLAELRARMRDRHGFETFDYGNFLDGRGEFTDAPDPTGGWRTYDHTPRYVTNMYGLRNRLAILSEAYSYADFRTRVAVTRAFVAEILGLAAERGPALVAACRAADEATVALGARGELQAATSASPASRGTETLLLRGFRTAPNAVTGELERIADGPRTAVELPVFAHFTGEGWVAAPRAYLLPAGPGFDRARVLEVLRAHGLRLQSAGPRAAEVDVYRLAGSAAAPTGFQGHHARRASFDVARERRELPAGTWRIPLDQPLARVAFQLLDPRAEDGLLAWNAFDSVLVRPGAEYPVWLEY